MDRNRQLLPQPFLSYVALRKESVDRNTNTGNGNCRNPSSLSARRAWIEMIHSLHILRKSSVALRKESVDRNTKPGIRCRQKQVALRKESVDRNNHPAFRLLDVSVALRKESVDRNYSIK